MAITSTRSNITTGRSLSFQEIGSLIPQNSSPGLYNYISFGISQGYTKSQLTSATNYFTYLQTNGFTTFLYSSAYYAIRTFTASTTFSNPIFAGATADVLIIAGGGGGASGGGGAGEMYEGSVVVPSSVSITVGAGGLGAGGLVDANGANGTSSAIGSLSCNGGGGAGRYTTGGTIGNAGGSGGGSSINYGQNTPASSTKTAGGFGFPGGNTIGTGSNGAAGGGGAGGAGGIGQTSGPGADGGLARASLITGVSTLYAGGGGGGTNPISNGGSGGGGGAGAGGTGNSATGAAGGSATANTGSGGGGTYYDGNNAGGNGGSGVVIIRFPLTVPTSFGA